MLYMCLCIYVFMYLYIVFIKRYEIYLVYNQISTLYLKKIKNIITKAYIIKKKIFKFSFLFVVLYYVYLRVS